jgi:hypothetical protein
MISGPDSRYPLAHAHYLYAVPPGGACSLGTVFFKAENAPMAELLRSFFAEEYPHDKVKFAYKAVSEFSQVDQLRHDEAISDLEVYTEPDRHIYDPPPPVDLHRRAQYALRAQRCVDQFNKSIPSAQKSATPKDALADPPQMTAEEMRVSGLNLLLLLAQAYYRLLEAAIGSPCHALDLDLNQSYLWTIRNIENLLKNNRELKDFPVKFTPLFPDLYPSTIKDSEWEDFIGVEADQFMADVQRCILSHAPTEAAEGSPAWLFVEMYRPAVLKAIERADAYHERMQAHFRRMLGKGKQQSSGEPRPAAPAGTNPPSQNVGAPLNKLAPRPTMPFNATAYRIMIASPSDVPEERALIHDAIHDWNAQHSEDHNVVLLPLAWETHTVPELGDRPQALVNKQVLKNADALVGVFWTRIGTATGVEISGTVEEIREHVRLKKPTMLYFSSRPVKPDQVDAVQYAAVKTFKAECHKLGLIDGYGDLHELRRKLDRHLTKLVKAQIKTPPVASSASTPPLSEVLSTEAQALLAEAVKDRDATVMYSATHDGTDLETNGKSLIPVGQPRKRAAFLAALKRLQQLGFLEDESGRGEIFLVTDAGFTAADELGFKVGGGGAPE